ncbi:uncharacterized protein [Rutidosis leptorrhynchoides]|uniref:uncharacterized protein n=1 Tax=Rutidosis leptorrhynchoides TaxID=125765 RepID=UPI003A998385
MLCNVSDIVAAQGWAWPHDWVMKYPVLPSMDVVQFSEGCDILLWRSNDGSLSPFSVARMWDVLRLRAIEVEWHSIVWYSQCIPRHSFIVSLLMGRKLKTQDRLMAWELRSDYAVVCPLCSLVMDSHDHLFFSCPFSKQVWTHMVAFTCLSPSCSAWENITQQLIQFGSRRMVRFIVAKLVFAACLYFIWQERNSRMFGKRVRSTDQLCEVIRSTVRLKLMSLNWKDSSQVHNTKTKWHIA